jgi:hypothetical protein
MSCEFSIPITLSVAEINASASAAITTNGGTFVATDNGGTFSVPTMLGAVAGSFEIISGSADVTIASKPFLVSCNKIEATLTKYIGGGSS